MICCLIVAKEFSFYCPLVFIPFGMKVLNLSIQKSSLDNLVGSSLFGGLFRMYAICEQKSPIEWFGRLKCLPVAVSVF